MCTVASLLLAACCSPALIKIKLWLLAISYWLLAIGLKIHFVNQTDPLSGKGGFGEVFVVALVVPLYA